MHDFTKGPWFTEATSRIGHFAITDADGFTVCDPSPMGQANARLLAAAPELLAALSTLLDSCTREVAPDGYRNLQMPSQRAIQSAVATIARATGEKA